MSIESNYNDDSLHLVQKKIYINEKLSFAHRHNHKLFVFVFGIFYLMGSKQKRNNLQLLFFRVPFDCRFKRPKSVRNFQFLLSWKLSLFFVSGILNCGKVNGTNFWFHQPFILDASSGFDGASGLVYPYNYCFGKGKINLTMLSIIREKERSFVDCRC